MSHPLLPRKRLSSRSSCRRSEAAQNREPTDLEEFHPIVECSRLRVDLGIASSP